MKKLFLLTFSLLCTVTVTGQNKALKINSISSSKEIIIKENKRIKIKTIDGLQIKGRFKTVGDSFIIIDDVQTLLAVLFSKTSILLCSISLLWISLLSPGTTLLLQELLLSSIIIYLDYY